MSRTHRKVPTWAIKHPEFAKKWKRNKVSSPIASGNEPKEEVAGHGPKRDAKKITRRARRRGKIPINFKK